MEPFIIFGARYLFLASLAISAFFFFKQNIETRKKLAWFYVLALPLTYALGLLGRRLWFNARPFVEKNIEPLISHSADNGFPSDHTLLLASLAAVMMYFDRKIAIGLLAITILVGLSRVLAELHHLLDILGSIVIALISSSLVYFVLKRYEKV